jgi:hypothetical protein
MTLAHQLAVRRHFEIHRVWVTAADVRLVEVVRRNRDGDGLDRGTTGKRTSKSKSRSALQRRERRRGDDQSPQGADILRTSG